MLRSRYRRILIYWAMTLLSLVWWEWVLPRLGLRGAVRRTRPQRLRRHARQYRSLAIRLGGVLIKVGQFLSSRVDVMPPEVIEELAGLQDEVPAEKFEDLRRVAEAEFGMALEAKYAAFDPFPLAAASLGQAHRATLKVSDVPEGASPNVVVKIQRPQIERIIATDLAALRRVGGWVNWYGPIRRRVNIPGLLDEFTRTLFGEIDYLAEGRNAETFAANFRGRPEVRVPAVFWTHTTGRVITLEDVSAIKISDYSAITAAGIDRAEVAGRLIAVYLKQIFEDGFFHADPHPGNLFVAPPHASPPAGNENEGESGWRLTFIDFGMVGHISPKTRHAMRELLIGIGAQDSARVVRAYQMLDFLLPGADLTKVEQIQTKLFERFWGKSMTELQQINTAEVTAFAYEFRDLLYSLPFQVPQDLIFLGRCVGILSGMATGLNPNYNVWEQLAPYAHKILMEEAPSGAAALLAETGDFLKKLVFLPIRATSILEKAERGELSVRTPDLTEQVRLAREAVRRMAGAVVFAALLLGGIQLFLGGHTGLAAILGAASLLAWLKVWQRDETGSRG